MVPDTSQNPRFSDQGDSGSVVVDANNKVLGLLFAGSTSGSATYLNPIQKALDELNVDLCVKTLTLVTHPVVCGPIMTKPTVCLLTKPVTCHIVTKPKLCQILTSPKYCTVKTLACPPKTLACPPISLACGFDPRLPPSDGFRSYDSPADVYGRPNQEGTDDGFWLGYYTALEAMSEAEADKSDD